MSWLHKIQDTPEKKGEDQFRPIVNHAGGIAIIGNMLYVTVDFTGLRVFNLDHIYKNEGTENILGFKDGKFHAFTYRYVLPQVGFYKLQGRFSFMSVDRTDPNKLGIITGNFQSPTSEKSQPRVLQYWNMNGRDVRSMAWDSLKDYNVEIPFRVQGAAIYKNNIFLASVAPPLLHVGKLQKDDFKFKTYPWVKGGLEDLYLDPTRNELWTNIETPGYRIVFAEDFTKFLQ